jgi:hypothetical protein
VCNQRQGYLVPTNELVVAKVTASICDYPHPDRSNVPIAVTAAVVTITSIFILLRLASKQWVSGGLAAEDWIIASALLLSFGSTYLTVTICHEGFGKHIWDLNDGDLSQILEYCKTSVYPPRSFSDSDKSTLVRTSMLSISLYRKSRYWFST